MGFQSQAGHVILRTQPTAGVLAPDLGTAGVGLKIKGGALAPSRDLLIPDAEIGGGRDVVDAYLGTVSFAGDYDYYPRLESLPTLLNAALGTKSTATATGISTHTITPADTSVLPFLSVEEQIADSLEVFNYTDAVVNTLHLESVANGFLTGTAGLIARIQAAGATPTVAPAYDNTPMIVGTNITVQYNGVSTSAKSFSWDINNNIAADDFRLGSFFLGDVTAKRREVTAQISLRHNGNAFWRQATYGQSSAVAPGGLVTKQPLVITMTTYENIVGGTPLTPASIQITIPNAILKPFAYAPAGDNVLENDVAIQAVRPLPGTPIMTIVVKNSKAIIA